MWNADLAYDSVRGVTVLFGGDKGAGCSNQSDETWEWDGIKWMQRLKGQGPSKRTAHSMVFDSARGKTVLFAGAPSCEPMSDTWEWDGTSWQEIPMTSPPPPRAEFYMAYDSLRNTTVVFGGWNEVVALEDTWERACLPRIDRDGDGAAQNANP